MNKICTIHQVEHSIWLGLLHKFNQADVIVLGDTFQFKKNYYENRNKIRTNNAQGWEWITVPVESHNHKPIKDIKISQDPTWSIEYLNKIINNYKNAPYFDLIYPEIVYIIEHYSDSLLHLNENLIFFFMKKFNIFKPIFFTSDLDLNPNLKSTDLLVEICKKVEADIYLSGPSGKDYLELNKFRDIKVLFHEFQHPIYKQQFTPFISGMSALDYLFNCGGIND